ncbi:uncharacterized protein [Periplaneta americana]|uniref:uncharacterized protein isoform X2 n=1 Tax=Periplaneta americana TaxID=6978 RepID=UPI0037E89335
MDVVKVEIQADPLGLQPYDNTYKTEEEMALLEEGNLSHLEVTAVKTECVDQSYDIKSEIKVEDATPVPISFPVVKTEFDQSG